MLNVSEVLTILEKEGLTSSRQVVLRWIRQGDLPAVQESRKIGYQLEQSDLDDFIARKKKQLQAPNPPNRQPTTIKQATRQP
jgi:predicted site-specific integrase-resolvase